MQGRRTGKLTDSETYRRVHERNELVRDLAAAEGVQRQAIYNRLKRERERRAAEGLEVHRGKRGRKPAASPVAAKPTPGRAVLLTADAMIDDMLYRAERVRPFFIDPPDLTPVMDRKRRRRMEALSRAIGVQDAEAGR